MLWLEDSKDPVHGGGDWVFGKALFSPARKRGLRVSRCGFWETLLRVKAGDPVLHIRGRNTNAAFVGTSVAESDGHETEERPPQAGQWTNSRGCYRVWLRDYKPFATPVSVATSLGACQPQLREYMERNRRRAKGKRRTVFLNLKRTGRVMPLEGAYLTEVEPELLELLLGPESGLSPGNTTASPATVQTSERIAELKQRVGQDEFSQNVRDNCGHRCCIPQCAVRNDRYLVGAHIVRWADDEEARGDVRNGLCLCLMHDRAFELGQFVVADDLTVRLNSSKSAPGDMPWFKRRVVAVEGRKLRKSSHPPLTKYLRRHRKRHDFRE